MFLIQRLAHQTNIGMVSSVLQPKELIHVLQGTHLQKEHVFIPLLALLSINVLLVHIGMVSHAFKVLLQFNLAGQDISGMVLLALKFILVL